MIYDRDTAEKLVTCHGPDRAALILRGADDRTNVDIMLWRGIGGETAIRSRRDTRPDPTLPLEDRVMGFVARGDDAGRIANWLHVPLERVQAIIEAHA